MIGISRKGHRRIKHIKKDVNFGLLIAILVCVSLFVTASFFYMHKIELANAAAEQEMAKLKKIEQQLILKEQELELLRKSAQDILDDKKSVQSNLLNLESEYQTLRIADKAPTPEPPKPFSKTICKTTGNAGC